MLFFTVCRSRGVVVAALLGAAQASGLAAAAAPEAPDPGIELAEKSAPFVEVRPVGPRPDQIWGRPIPGHVSVPPSARTNVGVLVDGRVYQILVRPGESVAAGAPLLRIQSTGGGVSRAEAELATARLAAAEESLKRVTTMVARGVATEVERLDAEVRLREARIDGERTRKAVAMLGDGAGPELTVTAPAGGTVIAISAAIGAVVQAGTEVVQIGDAAQAWIEADVNEDDANAAAPGEQAQIELLRGAGGRIEGKVAAVTAQIDPATRRRKIFVAPEKGNASALTLGLPVEVRLPEPQEQLALPVEAVLIKSADRRIVYVQNARGRFEARDVIVADAAEGWVRVLKGLTPGERVVIKGALLLDGRSEQLL
jgi:cobalt-zinc-cadmium efflux system membrane fusion protein